MSRAVDTTLPLFDFAKARARDPDTSKRAAASIDITRLEAVVIAAIERHGPMATFELAEKTGLSLVTVSPRLRPLSDKGFVEDSGETRVGPSGRKSIVWRLK